MKIELDLDDLKNNLRVLSLDLGYAERDYATVEEVQSLVATVQKLLVRLDS
jgi:hypothetical protein